jgi:hypothetical protein
MVQARARQGAGGRRDGVTAFDGLLSCRMRDLRGALAASAAGWLLLAFATPARRLWAESGLGWLAPFLIWLVAIAALAVSGAARSDDRRKTP